MHKVMLATMATMFLVDAEAAPMSVECPVIVDEGYGPPSGTRPSGKVRDTKPAPKPRKRERRSPRHTQRRR
jgi:hypothetical protein